MADWLLGDKDETLRLWVDGKSASEIRLHFENRYTRNQIIGIAHRAQLQRAPMSPLEVERRRIQRQAKGQDGRGYPKMKAEKPKPVSPYATEMQRTEYDASPRLFEGQPRTMATVRSGECQWIPGNPSATAPLCGYETLPGKSLCAHHWARAHQPAHLAVRVAA